MCKVFRALKRLLDYTIRFQGTVAQVEEAFRVEIHKYVVKGRNYYAYADRPSVPRELSPLIQTLLDDFPMASGSAPLLAPRPFFTTLRGTRLQPAIGHMDSAGNLYGAISGGGSLGAGAVFKLDGAGSETVLPHFHGNERRHDKSFQGDQKMPIEKTPISLPDGWNTYVPADSKTYSPVNDDSWETLAECKELNSRGLSADDLCEFNFGTRIPEEINWYLHFKVGCTLPTDDYDNYCFSTADHTPILKKTADGKPFIGDDGRPVIIGFEEGADGRSRVYLPELSAKLSANEYPDIFRLRCDLCLTQEYRPQLDLFFAGGPPRLDDDFLDLRKALWRLGPAEAKKTNSVDELADKIKKQMTVWGFVVTPDLGTIKDGIKNGLTKLLTKKK